MKISRFDAAKEEARRFLEKAAELDRQLTSGRLRIIEGKHAAAVRRASMDLTRALADLRRSDNAN